MDSISLRRDAWLLTHFRNGWSMVKHLRGGPAPHAAVTWTGRKFVHPPGQEGLLEVILEVWHGKIYQPPGFYSPSAGDIVIDLGANVGAFAVDILRQCRDVVMFCVEPSPPTLVALRHNVEAFGSGRATILGCACGREASRATVIAGSRSLDNHIQFSTHDANVDDVEVITLRQLVEKTAAARIAYLKVDIEGSEFEVFDAADADTLARIDRIALEYHDHIKPGASVMIRERLAFTHNIVAAPAGVAGCGMLYARRNNV